MRGFRKDLLQSPASFGVAVSGGADSVALLHLTALEGLNPVVLHVNHAFRGAESDEDEEFVRQLAARLGFVFLVHRPAVSTGNQEQSARRARYRWFRELIRKGSVRQVATAHTMDDQAETVLSRFLRGSGSAGLASIRPENRGIVRPLLEARRADLRAFLESRQLSWREDTSNAQLRFQRNRIRHQLLPVLIESWNPNLVGVLAQTAEWARDEEEYWRGALSKLTRNWVRFDKNSAVLDVDHLRNLPIAVARRALRYALVHVQGDSRQLQFHHIERLRNLAGRQQGDGSFVTARWRACRSGTQLRLSSSPAVTAPYSFTLAIPGDYSLPQQPVSIHLELKSAGSVYNDGGEQVDWERISGSLELRSWQPGDRFHQAGRPNSRKLKYFFQEAGIPSWERSGWPVITCANSILWTRGQGVAPDFMPSGGTRQILVIHEVASESPNQKVFV